MNRLRTTRRPDDAAARAEGVRRRRAWAADVAMCDATIAMIRTLLYYSPESVRVIQSVTRHALERQQAVERDRRPPRGRR